MTDLLYPQGTPVAASQVTPQGNAAYYRSPLSGASRTSERLGDLWTAKLSVRNLNGQDRARVQAFLAQLRGRSNRFYLQDHSYRQRGSFPAPELLTNNLFTNGTTSWTAQNSTLTVADRILRVNPNSDGTTGSGPGAFQQPVLAQYVPYVGRSILLAGRRASGLNGVYFFDGSGLNGGSNYASSTFGLFTKALVSAVASASGFFPVVMADATGFGVGDYLECAYTSVSGCALIDNAPNYAFPSDDMSNAFYSVSGVTKDVAQVAPDGTTTALNVKETTATSVHDVHYSVTIPSTPQDICLGWVLSSNGRGWCYLQMNTAGGSVYAYFNLTTGAVGTIATSTWTNARVFSVNRGAGWWAFYVVVRKTTTETSLACYAGLATADGTATYAGSTSQAMRYWRTAIALSSVPMALGKTTSAALTSGTLQTGVGLNVKGLPASTNGLLLTGDQVQIGDQLDIVSAPLNSDAAGLGYLQLWRPQRSPPADNAPVIINNPMGKFMLANNGSGWSNAPGRFSDADVDAIEDV